MTSPRESDPSFDSSMDLFDNDDAGEEGSSADAGRSHLVQKALTEQENATVGLTECPFCNKSVGSESGLHLHIESEHPDDNAKCNGNSLVSISDGSHIANGFMSSSRVVCPYCDLSHENKKCLAEHLTVHHGEDVERKDLEDLIRGLDLLLCPICSYVSSTTTEIQIHIEDQHSAPEQTVRYSDDAPDSSWACKDERLVAECPVCGVEESDPDLLRSHIELHFDSSTDLGSNAVNGAHSKHSSFPSSSKIGLSSSSTSSSSSSKTSLSSSSSKTSERSSKGKKKSNGHHYKQQYRQGLERALVKGKITPGDYYDQMALMKENDLTGRDDGHSRVKGLIEKLKSFYLHQSRRDQFAILCEPTDFFCGSYGDKGWGCGYRNFQMMLSSLSHIPQYSQRLFPGGNIEIPSVSKVQAMIETAWQKGFDLEGSLQLEGKLVNTRKWIGATEIVATLSSLGIRCELVDFPLPSSPDGTHPRLLKWVRDYFSRNENVKPPLYLQHQGHSRTIVGIEEEKGIIRLLLFDPGSSLEHVTSIKTGPLTWKQIGSFRKNQAGFKSKQYQIVSVTGVLSKDEYERSKKLTSTRIL